MLQVEDLKQELNLLQPRLEDLRSAIGYERLLLQKEELELKVSAPGFWDNLDNSQKVLKLQKEINDKINHFEELERKFQDTAAMMELVELEAADDEIMLGELKASLRQIDKDIEAKKLETLLSGDYDRNSAIMSFHAGAGGTEAQDWVEMLYRMYKRWAEDHGMKTKVLDYLSGEEAGIKSITISVTGTNAYGFLKSESGVHRLVRISPFDPSGKRHTSFASIEVMPELDENTDIEIKMSDLKVDTYRSGGAGGQHVNKTESAIRITHIPTGVIVASQQERSQHQNREVAMKMLKAKLVQIKEMEHLEKIEDIKGEHKDIAWGSQIRSYVFMPYTLVKDHRTGFESGNISAVIDGDIDPFINAYLQAKSKGDL